ncbi:MAG TPA: hypothetical protein VGP82_06410 [Ktedonobacterales bacterium]|jgi:hypothetical protein|nr:hypothetical protein [Ktedonobacterales bacterium]
MTHALLKKKRLDLRSPGHNRKKPVRPQIKWIVGDDFKAVLAECQQLLAIACEPVKGGRPRKFAGVTPHPRVTNP